ncbi:MAG: pseudouridine synthase [Shinella sp.]|nr:pseudouridine synthase [Shinella sp.]
MTSKDKPKRPGAKPFDGDRKPRDGAKKPAGKKPYAAAGARSDEARKPRGEKKPGAKPFAAKPARERAAAAVAADQGGAQVPERISKLLARAGVASRRDVERMIMEGRVSLNGAVLDTPVVNATLADHIEVDGQPIRGIERTRLWLYHKPAGLVTTNSDPEGRPTVFENLPAELPRVLSIGRLDINTEGLLLLTNDGGLARVLELPATGWLRRYRVRAHGKIDQEALDRLKDGIAVEGVLYGGIDATLDKVQGSNVWITMGLREGKNREIKNVLGALGLEVNRLIRISYGPFQLGELPEGHAQEIRGRTLRDQLGPRLIEEAKANFDAPLFNRETEEQDEKPTRAAKPTHEERETIAFREKPGDRREKARARLDTKRDDRFGEKRGDRFGDKREKPGFGDRPGREPGNRARKSNVWMAPGARPIAEKKAKSEGAEEVVKREPRGRPEGAPKVKRFGRTWEGEPTRTKSKFDPDRKKASGGVARGERQPRVLAPRDADDADWIRASEPERRPREEGERGSFGRKRSGAGDERAGRDFADRPPRADRKPRAEGERGFADRAGDRPRGKPFGAKGGGKSFGGKPGGKPFGGKPGGGRSGVKPAGGRPRGKGK